MVVDSVVSAAVVVEVERLVVVEEVTGLKNETKKVQKKLWSTNRVKTNDLDPAEEEAEVHFTSSGQSQKLLSELKTSPVGQKN